MKISKILIIISLILCISITANAEGLEESNIKNGKRYEFENEFSMLVPQDFDFFEIEQSNFVNSKVYEYESKEERLRVIISSQQSTDENFKDLDYLIRKDLDYKLLTNEQLLLEYDTFEQVIADSVPVYMDYLPVSSVTIDERLALVCNAYYTENESYATGMIKAYRFYYMGNLVTLYYDTLIEGNYYNEKAFFIFDEIVSSIDFKSNPTSNASNPAILARIVSIMIKPLAVIALALFIGIILGVITKSSKGKRVSGEIGSDVAVESNKKTEPVMAAKLPKSEPKAALDIDEGADWNLLFEQAKNENKVINKDEALDKKSFIENEEVQEIQEVEKDDYDIIVEDVIENKQDKITEIGLVNEQNDDEINHEQQEEIKQQENQELKELQKEQEKLENQEELIQQNEQEHQETQEEQQIQYDYDLEHELQSDYVKNLLEKQKQKEWQEEQERQNRIDKVNQMLDSKLNEDIDELVIKNDDLSGKTQIIVGRAKRHLGHLDQEIDETFSKKEVKDKNTENKVEQGFDMNDYFSSEKLQTDNDNNSEILESDNEIFETLKKGCEQTLENLVKIEVNNKEEEKELDDNKDFFASKLIRKKDNTVEPVDTEYIDRMLPEKNKIENKKNIKALQKEVLNFLHEEISEKVEKTSKVKKEKKEKVKLKGASKFLNSIVDRIVGEGNIDDEILADVESRKELHRSEKVDNNKYDELIPGITDAYEEKEVVEIVMDEYEEIKYLNKEDKKKD